MVRFALKLALIAIGLVVVATLVVVFLTDPAPSRLPARFGAWASEGWSRRPARPAPTVRPTSFDEPVPLFSDGWIDDSGYGLAVSFSASPADPTSLAEIGSSAASRGRRGITALEAQLAALDPANLRSAAELNLSVAALLMYEGDFAAADVRLARIQKEGASAMPAEFLANVEAMRGVAALRLGEVENCVACRNEASCIFPLSPAAVHLRPSGSRGPIEHFTRYLRERPEDLGVPWLLNVAHMTVGTYPEGVPAEFLLPLGRFRPLRRRAARVGWSTSPPASASTPGAGRWPGRASSTTSTATAGLTSSRTTADPSSGAAFWHNRGDGSFEDRSTAAGLDDQVHGPQRLSRRLRQRRESGPPALAGRLGDPAPALAAPQPGWRPIRGRDPGRRAGRPDRHPGRPAGPTTTATGCSTSMSAGEYSAGQPDPRNLGRLYRNRGDGTFVDLAGPPGSSTADSPRGWPGATYDNDGCPDLYVSNLGKANRLYRNNGDGTFTDLAEALGVAGPIRSFACWFWDLRQRRPA